MLPARDLVSAVLTCACLACPCRAMLTTPASPEDSLQRINAAVGKRQLSQIDPESISFAKERAYAVQVDSLKTLKSLDNPTAPATFDPVSDDAISGDSKTANVALLLATLAIPLLLTALLIWLTRRANGVRERERHAMLKGLRPTPPPAEPPPPRKTQKFTLREVILLCDHIERENTPPKPDSRRLKKPDDANFGK